MSDVYHRGAVITFVPSRNDWVAGYAEDDGVMFLGRFASVDEAQHAVDDYLARA